MNAILYDPEKITPDLERRLAQTGATVIQLTEVTQASWPYALTDDQMRAVGDLVTTGETLWKGRIRGEGEDT